MDNPIEINANWGDDFTDWVSVFVITRDADGHAHRVMLAADPEPMGEVALWNPPIGMMTRRSAQFLLDRLWGLGFRPSGDATPGQLAATKAHLEDMKMIAYRLLDHILIREK